MLTSLGLLGTHINGSLAVVMVAHKRAYRKQQTLKSARLLSRFIGYLAESLRKSKGEFL
jgi:hypothetical protein